MAPAVCPHGSTCTLPSPLPPRAGMVCACTVEHDPPSSLTRFMLVNFRVDCVAVLMLLPVVDRVSVVVGVSCVFVLRWEMSQQCILLHMLVPSAEPNLMAQVPPPRPRVQESLLRWGAHSGLESKIGWFLQSAWKCSQIAPEPRLQATVLRNSGTHASPSANK